jgi:hypothetical protein
MLDHALQLGRDIAVQHTSDFDGAAFGACAPDRRFHAAGFSVAFRLAKHGALARLEKLSCDEARIHE